jgi:hypothetical protein
LKQSFNVLFHTEHETTKKAARVRAAFSVIDADLLIQRIIFLLIEFLLFCIAQKLVGFG